MKTKVQEPAGTAYMKTAYITLLNTITIILTSENKLELLFLFIINIIIVVVIVIIIIHWSYHWSYELQI